MIIYLHIFSLKNYKTSEFLYRKDDDKGLEISENIWFLFQKSLSDRGMDTKYFFNIKISSYIDLWEENGRRKSNHSG